MKNRDKYTGSMIRVDTHWWVYYFLASLHLRGKINRKDTKTLSQVH